MTLTTLGEILLIASTFAALLLTVPDLFSHPAHDFLSLRLVIGATIVFAIAGMSLFWLTSRTGWFLIVGGLASLLGLVGDRYWRNTIAEHRAMTKRARRQRMKELGRPQDRAALFLIALAAFLGSAFIAIGGG